MVLSVSDQSAEPSALALGEQQRFKNPAFPLSGYLVTASLAALAVILTEWISRGDFQQSLSYLVALGQPALPTLGIVFVALIAIDAIIGREHKGILIVLPLLLIAAVVNHEKQYYLSDPLYPSDFLFARQVMELLPVLVQERPGTALALATGALAVGGLVIWSWVFAWRRFPTISPHGRMIRLAITIPLLASCVAIIDYDVANKVRDRLHAIPMVWDQKTNYKHNGLVLAFMFNMPMANVPAPAGYSRAALDGITVPAQPIAATKEKPDIIVIMSESFWDPTRMPNVKFDEDPMPFIRSMQGGHMFSPEFGGLTANIEFEAITGFSNAFLPYGSVAYQQYIRHPIPSMATFLRSEGYRTEAIHPFKGWFWNRTVAYDAMGFEKFRTLDVMPPLPKRGKFPADDALMKDVMKQADGARSPFYFYTVTLQGHGPYEAHRYEKNTVAFDAGNMPEKDRESFATYVEGVKQADESLKMLFDWAKKRERETIIVFFGDHLPPLGNAYISGGLMQGPTADRRAPLVEMKREHETPLIIWSSKSGPLKDIGTISPALIPHKIAELAGLKHPFYTGFLGQLSKDYDIVDRYMLEGHDGSAHPDWPLQKPLEKTISDYHLIEYDIMFGKQYGLDRFFPEYSGVIGKAGS